MASKIIKKTLEEAQGVQNAELDFSDKALISLEPDMSRMWGMKNITRLTLSHNKITELPPAVANLENLEILNLFNNCLEEVPVSLSGMPKLRILNLVSSLYPVCNSPGKSSVPLTKYFQSFINTVFLYTISLY